MSQNKILKDIAIKLGATVGEHVNDTNELLTAIAVALGANPTKKYNNVKDTLELIRDNISEGGSGGSGSGGSGSGSGSIVLPYYQTNPDFYFYKPFTSMSTISIDFTKFVDWYERTNCADAFDYVWNNDEYQYMDWADSDDRANNIPVLGLDWGYKSAHYSYSSSYRIDLNLKIYTNRIELELEDVDGTAGVINPTILIVSNDTGKSVLECLREVGTVNINLMEAVDQSWYGMPEIVFIYHVFGEVSIKQYKGELVNIGFNYFFEYINSIDWIKVIDVSLS